MKVIDAVAIPIDFLVNQWARIISIVDAIVIIVLVLTIRDFILVRVEAIVDSWTDVVLINHTIPITVVFPVGYSVTIHVVRIVVSGALVAIVRDTVVVVVIVLIGVPASVLVGVRFTVG